MSLNSEVAAFTRDYTWRPTGTYAEHVMASEAKHCGYERPAVSCREFVDSLATVEREAEEKAKRVREMPRQRGLFDE